MSRIIAVANVKGGVGKTTTTGNLAAALAERGRKVLAIDLDPQASLSITLGFKPKETTRTIGNALKPSPSPLGDLLARPRYAFDLVPANHTLRQTERELENGHLRVLALRNALEPVRAQYDYILLDCPANAGILTHNALAASNEIVIPFPADYLALQALEWFFPIIREIQRKINPGLRVAGLFLTMYDPDMHDARQIILEAQEMYGTEVPFFSAAVPQSVAIKQAARAGQSILEFASDSAAAAAYRQLALEVEDGVKESVMEDAYAAVRRGKGAFASGDRTRAYLAFRQATELKPLLVEAWLGRAESAPEWDEAIRGFSQVLVLEPAHEQAHSELAGRLDGLLRNFGDADIPMLMEVGFCLAERGQRRYARQVFTQITEIDPNSIEAWRGRGRTEDDALQVVHCYEQAVRLAPDVPQHGAELAAAQSRLRDEAAALVDKGGQLVTRGLTEDARLTFEKASQMDPQNENAWIGLARTADDLEKGLGFVQQALKINPNNVEARELYSWLWSPQPSVSMLPHSFPPVLSLLVAAVIIFVSLVLLFHAVIH